MVPNSAQTKLAGRLSCLIAVYGLDPGARSGYRPKPLSSVLVCRRLILNSLTRTVLGHQQLHRTATVTSGLDLLQHASLDRGACIPMIVVRNCFTAKHGNASKLAAQLKEAAAVSGIPKYRILTDLTGDFNRVVLEFEAENVTEFETRLREYSTNTQFRERMVGYTDLWISGSREILQIA
jgi:hypothetical protein